MKSFEYGDQEISHKEIMFAVPSMVVGLGILTLPQRIAGSTNASDGWASILGAGIIILFFVWITAKLAAQFPKMTFVEYAARLISKPAAITITLLFALYLLMFTSNIIRSVANVAKDYLFERTPLEVLMLVFFLVVIYGAAGSRAGLLRLNLMFFPVALIVLILILLFNLKHFEIDNILPVFQTEWSGYMKAARESLYSFLGFEIVLFYIALMNRTQKAPKAAMVGMTLPILIYMIVYIVVIGVFGNQATSQIIGPLIDLAKEVIVPGQFFERIESIFFVIWIMTLFNTTAMAFDVSIIALTSVFTKTKKINLIFITSPFVFLIGILPNTFHEIMTIGTWISYFGIFFSMLLPALLFIISKIRRVRGYG